MNEFKVAKSALPKWVRKFVDEQGYKGRKFTIEVRDRVTIPTDAGMWGGGTRETYFAVDRDGSSAGMMNGAAPWRSCGRGETVELPEGAIMARRSWFCGKDCGFTFYVRAPSVPTLTGCGAECGKCHTIDA